MTAATCGLCAGEIDAGTLCGRCVGRLERTIAELPALAGDLELTITRQTVGAGASLGRRAASSTPLPFEDSPRIDDARHALAVLEEWAAHVGGQPRAAGDMRSRARRAAAELLGRLEWFRQDVQAHDAAVALLRIRASLRRAVDRPASRVYAGPCDGEMLCLELDLAGDVLTPRAVAVACRGEVWAEPGDPLAVCSSCRMRHPVADRRAFTLAALEDELLPLADVLAALPVLTGRNPAPATVRKWRSRGRLAVAGRDAQGRELYRGGDVIRLALDDTTRPGPRRQDPRGIPA